MISKVNQLDTTRVYKNSKFRECSLFRDQGDSSGKLKKRGKRTTEKQRSGNAVFLTCRIAASNAYPVLENIVYKSFMFFVTKVIRLNRSDSF